MMAERTKEERKSQRYMVTYPVNELLEIFVDDGLDDHTVHISEPDR